MTDIPPLSLMTTRRILAHFELPPDLAPDRESLQRLIDRYTRTVPWESFSRLVRRARHQELEDCALLGEAFWASHFQAGSGGTCYESNYAFFSFLRRLGFDGYLTLNDMRDSIGCHSAIVLFLDGRKTLVDVGLPVYAPLPLDASLQTSADSRFFRYTVEPLADDRYDIWREGHPEPYVFTLVDQPVADAAYRRAAINDYQPGSGYFLDKVVINKVVNDQLWRFNSKDPPPRIQTFINGDQRSIPLECEAAAQLSQAFKVDRGLLESALESLGGSVT